MRKLSREKTQTRSLQAELKTRSETDDQEMIIEGYFAVFGTETELWPGAYEELAPGAFNGTLGNDVRALVNHDTTLVLGRNKANTLELRADSHGLWGSIKINPNDSDAVNLYARVQRNDVTECSFGFNILNEVTDFRDDGTVKWLITEIDLHEVSVCTFAQYIETGVQARKAEVAQHKERQIQQRKNELKARLNKCH